MIQVSGLTKSYGGHTAVDHLSFTMETGQIHGILGPNGAGKSTTMNMITGCLAPTGGDVWLDGVNIFDEPEKIKGKIGYLPEIPPVYPDMTPREYLSFVAGLKGIPKKEIPAAVEEAMAATYITDKQDRLIGNLSKGYKQRVGISQAILGKPEIVILDEPTVGLDPLQRIEVRELIRGLGGEHTVLLSSHILSEISEVADVVLILSHGRLVAQDTPENLAKRAAGSNRTTVTVKGEKETVLAAVAALPLTVTGAQEKPEGLLELQLESESDIREALFYALAEARCPILEESAAAVSLEDIFLELTGEEEAARAAEAEAAETVRAAREKQAAEEQTAEAAEIAFEGKEEA